MTYRFLCKYVKPRIAAWLTAVWFAVLLILMLVLSSNEENPFLYMDF